MAFAQVFVSSIDWAFRCVEIKDTYLFSFTREPRTIYVPKQSSATEIWFVVFHIASRDIVLIKEVWERTQKN